MVYGAECWAVRKKEDRKLQTTETRILRWVRGKNNARNGSREKKQRKATKKMGERNQRHVRYDDSGKQSGGVPASISQRHLGSDVLTRIC